MKNKNLIKLPHCLLLFIFLALLTLTSKTQIIIKGVVSDKNGLALPNATVSFKIKNEEAAVGAFTKPNGSYSIHISPKAGAILCVTYLTGKPACIEITNGILKDTIINFRLGNIDILLDTVVIKSKAPIKMDTTSFAADSIKKLYHRNLEALLKEIPGLININGQFLYKGKLVSKILFEGDNLTGADYKRILKNLSTNGLDSIQIIENYVDKTELGNFYKKYGDEVVINFTFKGKKKLRNYGRTYAGLGLPATLYEAKLDDIAFLKKIKTITLANANNNGNSSEYLQEKSGIIIPYGITTTNVLHPLSIVNDLSTQIEIQDISPYFVGADRIYVNKTFFVTNDFYSRLSNKIFLSGTIGYNNERLLQNTNQNNIYFDTSFTSVFSKANANKKNSPLSIKNNVSWLISPTVQYSATVVLTNKPVAIGYVGSINNDSNIASYKSSMSNWLLTHKITWLINKNKQLNFQFFNGNNNLKESNYRESPIYKNFFQNNTIAGINQFIYTSNRFMGAVAHYNLLAKRYTFDFFAGTLLQRYQLQTGLSTYNNQNNEIPVGNEYGNYNKYKQGIWYGSVKVNKSVRVLKKSINFLLQPVIIYNNLSITDVMKITSKKIKQVPILLPNASVTLKINENISLSSAYSTTNIFTSPVSFYSGAILRDETTFYKGFDTIVSFNNSSTNFTLYFKDKKGKFNLSLSYNTGTSPVGNGARLQPNGLISYLQPEYINKPNRYSSVGVVVYNQFKKASININANSGFRNSTYVTNNFTYQNRSFDPSLIINVSTFGTKNTSQLFDAVWSGNFQKNTDGLGNVNRSNYQMLKLAHEFSCMFKKAYTLTLSQKYILSSSTEATKNQYYFIDLFASRTFKNDRFTIFLNAKNLTNQNKFVDIINTGYNQIQTFSSILPRMLLIGFEMKF